MGFTYCLNRVNWIDCNYPFREFFLKRMENKKRWVLWQKVFSAIGVMAVVAADIFVVMAYF